MIWVWIIGAIALLVVLMAIILIVRRHNRIKAELAKLREEQAREREYKQNNLWLVEQFQRCNVIVYGKKRTGKDLLFAHVIYLRDDKHYANMPYNGNTEVIELKDISVGNNDFISIIENKIEQIDRSFESEKDIYISDAGIFLPSQYNEKLDKLYPGMPIFFAICGHLYQNNIHLNVQELTRVWNKLREQADCYIRVLGNVKYRNYVLIKTITYTEYNSAVHGILPPLINSQQEYDKFVSQYGEVVYRTFKVYWSELEYDTHYFAKKFFKESLNADTKVLDSSTKKAE